MVCIFRCRYFRCLIVIAMLFLLTITTKITAAVRPWYYPDKLSINTVNPYLTPSRLSGQCPPSWHKQLVLWEGVIEQQSNAENSLPILILKCNSQNIPVYFSRKVRNLDVNRCGYRVAIKGKIILNRLIFSHLEGLSVILISPSTNKSFASWAATADSALPEYLAWRVALHQPHISKPQAIKIGHTIFDTAKAQQIDPILFASLIQIESAYNPKAVSASGAMGLGQLMPFTAKDLHVNDPFDPLQNLKGAGHMIGQLTREWSAHPNCSSLVLASYNAGPNCVRRLGGRVPPYSETINYVYFIGYLRQSLQAQIDALGIIN